MSRAILLSALFGCVFAGLLEERSITSSSINTQKLVERHDYPFEKYEVQTEDGYILEVHRIPHSPKNGPGSDKPVVFLQHGLLCSSSDWVLSGPENGLAFLLSDLGYDVWMGNARGNTYSRKHTKYTPLLQFFWNFSWHEIGQYDIPAMIDHVRSVTGADKIDYVGHSQGTTAFFVMNSIMDKYEDIIRSAHMLAPVGYMHNMKSPLASLGARLLGQRNAFVSIIGSMEFLPNNKLMELLGSAICKETATISAVCTNTLFLIGGFNEDNVNKTLLPEILATTPAGCSVNQILHYLQEYNSGFFRQWDYGLLNKKHYNENTPPKYRVENIRVPTYFYFSDNDYLASVADVKRLISEIPASSVKGIHHVEDSTFTHIDFLWGLNVKDMVYKYVIENLALSKSLD
ncbi:LIPA.2 family protein [Megaselia abdita]